MIQVNQVAYSYGAGKVIRFPDFAVNTGMPCLLLGESGSGKTTLLHLIGGLLRVQHGRIIINETDVTKLSETKLDKFRGKHMGFIFQKNHLITALSVRKNLMLAPYLSGIKKDEQRLQALLNKLGLSEKLDANVNELSHGQAQRVAIARAVINKPSVILADEPTSALDDRNCERVIDVLLDIARINHSTLFIATHDQRLKSKIEQQIAL